MKFLIEDDIIIGIGSGDILGIDVGEFAGVDISRLRFNGDAVVDVSERTEWHIDAHGVRHIFEGPDRTALTCALADEIEPDGSGGWRMVEPEIRLIKYAADLRWQREVGGVVVGGVPVATDDRSKVMITGARVAAGADPDWSTVWHGADGQTYPVDAAAMVAISDAVQAHVNSSFATFASVKAAIDAGEITTTDEIDAAFAG